VATFGVLAMVWSVGFGVTPQQESGPRELMYLGTRSGVTAVNSETGKSVFSAPGAVAAGGWSILAAARPLANARTRLEAIDPATGRVLEAGDLDGKLRVRTVSFDGRQIALMPRGYGGGLGKAEGRRTTRLVLANFDGAPARTLDIDANVEPEAFSTDKAALFVLQYKPPMHPNRYQVRRLDLATGRLADVFTNDKDIQGDMQGIARTQALSPDGNRLYTLYTKQEHGEQEAFVHVLSLDSQVANCVDLPKPFGRAPEALALTASPDGNHLYAADTQHGRVTEVDTRTLKVKRTDRISTFSSGQGPAAITASDSAIYVARGGKVSGFGVVSFNRFGTWRFGTAVRSLQVAVSEETELFIAERRRVTVLDGVNGTRLSHFPTPSADGVSHVGYMLPQTSIGSYQCAC
jgi:hypothetical protein